MANEYAAVPRRSVLGVWREYPVAMTIALLTGVVIGGVVAFALSFTFSDDEAPIRVRSGSMEFELLDESQEWEGSQGTHHVKNKQRTRNEYDITVAAYAAGVCTAPLHRVAAVVRFTYSVGNTQVTFHATGNKTIVTGQVSPAGHRLTHGTAGQGFISRIEVGPNPGQVQQFCSFTSREQLDSVLLLNLP